MRHWNLSQNPDPRWTWFETPSDQFDAVGNRKKVILGNADSIIYDYDNLYRLTNENYKFWDAGSSTYKDLRLDLYAYDHVGNRGTGASPGKRQTNYYPPGVPSTKNESYYTHDDNNKMQTEAVYKYVWSGGGWVPYDTDVTAFEYDGNGNMTRQTLNGQSVTSFGYDAEDRLTTVTFPDSTSNSFVYYGDGLRRSKVDSFSTRNYYYDGDDILAESDGAGSFPVGYSYGALGLITEITYVGGDWYPWWHHGDFIGSTHLLAGVGGQILTTYAYDAYGIPVNEQGPYENFTAFKYVGQLGYYKDRDHRMMLLGARYYDPYTGRFITQDPIGYAGGMDPYEYAGSNPVGLADPSGLKGAGGLWEKLKAAYAFVTDLPRAGVRGVVHFLTRGARVDPNLKLCPTVAVQPSPQDTDVSVWQGFTEEYESAPRRAATYIDKLVMDPLYATAGWGIVGAGIGRLGRACEAGEAGGGARFTPDQSALIQLAKEYRKRGGVSMEDVGILREWAGREGLTFEEHLGGHPGRGFGRLPHIHVGPVDHIRVR